MTDINEATNQNETLLDSNMPDVPPQAPSIQSPEKVFLQDYQPPSFQVTKVELDIRVFDDNALVDAQLHLVREHEGDLVLYGRELTLISIELDGEPLPKASYQLDDERLVIANAPASCVLRTQVKIDPKNNTALEGLYQAGEDQEAMYVTQCEPEGFRKITFYPDRPDVLAEFTTRLEASQRFPTLLANGNLVEKGELPEGRHYAIWHDPTKKPSYLFACVIADLDVLTDHFVTSEGREVLLELYAKSADIDKCHVGMQALKDAMKWDEENYGRAYDLNRYMIVAVSQFNMGAMENKGLNIFNTACVLSSPETTTDARSFNVKSVIAHEYFHNWTGNRITCRDWFQLCLKEGFTVYRDQSFSADQQSAAVQRIDDVSVLRAHQFTEDAGPLAHPVRPESFVEINNFYTATVYEKGAEIVRMIANTLGKEKFRQGTDEYFRRYDGQAVTVEDFLSALSVGGDVEKFLGWYQQPGTPVVSGYQEYDAAEHTLTIHLEQSTRQVSGFDAPKPLPIPIDTAIFNPDGQIVAKRLLMLEKEKQDFVFTNITKPPVVSLLRNFSAPVQLNYQYTDEELSFLLAHETNGFNRWQATQNLVNRILLKSADASTYLQSIIATLPQLAKTDAMLAARLLDIPSERELASAFETDYDPNQIKAKRQALKQQVAEGLKAQWQSLYEALPIQDYQDDPVSRGERTLRNVVLDMALTAQIADAKHWAMAQYEQASCMTERLGTLNAMVAHQLPQASALLDDFYQRFSQDDLVIDLWFGIQAGQDNSTPQIIETLIHHKDFDWKTPNRVRAVMGNFASQPVHLWTEKGLSIYTQVVCRLDKENPVLASRLLQALSRWYTLKTDLKDMAERHLQNLRQEVSSKNVVESLESVLRSIHHD